MSLDAKNITDRLQELFNRFYDNPDEFGAFYTWRSDLELYLKRPAKFVRENQEFYAKLLPVITHHFQMVPSRWNAETVALKMRFSWLLEDMKSINPSILSEDSQGLGGLDPEPIEKVYELGEQRYVKSPQVVLTSHRGTRGSDAKNFVHDSNLSHKARLKKCKTQESFNDLSAVLLQEFYNSIEIHDPDSIVDFLKASRPVYVPLMRKVSNNDLLIAFLDILPHILFQGHRAPYDPGYIDCARLLRDILIEILEDPKTDFKGEDCASLDDTLHHLCHSLFYYLEQGRLVAFEDAFKVILALMEAHEKFGRKFNYLPMIPELYYWIPQAYSVKIRCFMFSQIRLRLLAKPNSILRLILHLETPDSKRTLDERILVSEFLLEMYKDRQILDSDRKVIHKLIASLKFPIDEYKKLLREVFRELRLVEICDPGSSNRRELMTRLIQMSTVRGKTDPARAKLLFHAARALEISVAEFKELEKYIHGLGPQAARILPRKGLRRVSFSGVPLKLLKSLEWYKWKQMKLEEYQRAYGQHARNEPYHPENNKFVLQGEVEKNFSPLSGEIKVTAFDLKGSVASELGILVYCSRDMLRRWFEIVNQVEYLIYDHSLKTFSLELFLTNFAGSIMMTRELPVNNPGLLKKILEQRAGHCRFFIVEEETRQIVHWQPSTCYITERAKVEPLLDALKTKNFTSIKVISQIGQRRNPDEIMYYHAMIENVIFLGANPDETREMIDLCHRLLKGKFRDDFKTYYYLGYLYFELGQPNKGYEWLAEGIRRKPDYKDALLLYCEKKSEQDILDPQCLGYLKYLDLCFPRDARLKALFEGIERRYSIKLQHLIAGSRLMMHSTFVTDS
jgi:hypothetical protein